MTGTLRNVVGTIGNVISFGLFISPAPTFYRMVKKGSTEEFHPYPYLCCMMNCMTWIFYGLPFVTGNNTLIITINGVGLVLEIIYLLMFFWYTTKKNRKIICVGVVAELVAIAALVLITMFCIDTIKTRTNVVGVVANVFGIIMYGSPLSIIKKVVQTKSPEFMPFWLCLAGFVNGICWFTYANLDPFQLYVCIGNGIGGLLGLIQLLVYGFYKCWGKPTVKDDAKPGDVQLQNTKNMPV